MGETKKSRRKAIQNLLKNSQIGLSITNIAEELGYSRNTVSKYLKILKEEGKVYDRELGQYSIWLHNDARLYYEKDKAKGQMFALETYKHFLQYLDNNHPELGKEGKQIGNYMGKNMDILNLISPELLEFDLRLTDLNNLAKFLMDLLDNTYLSMDSYEWETHSIIDRDEVPPMIILRLKDSQYFSTPINFSMLAGVLEIQINSLLKNEGSMIRIDIKDTIPNKKVNLVELQITIHVKN